MIDTIVSDQIHFIGINGIGMSGLARLLLEKGGIRVTGSDKKIDGIGETLRAQGAILYEGHHPDNLPKTGSLVVVVSSSISQDNKELLAAQERGICVLHRSDLLRYIMRPYMPLLITGTHGKTTTSSLLAHTLVSAGIDPGFAVGGVLRNYMTNARHGNGQYFVAEADESDGTFLKYDYDAAIVTNIDSDHLAHFQTMDGLEKAFAVFMGKAPMPEHLFYCGDDPRLSRLSPTKSVSYGFSSTCAIQPFHVRHVESGVLFNIRMGSVSVDDLFLPLYGNHNVLNASSVYGLAISIGLSEPSIRQAFRSFSGVKKRMEKKYDSPFAMIIDDYGHHPTEIAATLAALRLAVATRPITAVFQPHRPSRMRYCIDEIKNAFIDADAIVLTDVYLAGEPVDERVSTHAILERIRTNYLKMDVRYIPRKDLVISLVEGIREGDVVIFFGAGDSSKASEELANMMRCT